MEQKSRLLFAGKLNLNYKKDIFPGICVKGHSICKIHWLNCFNFIKEVILRKGIYLLFTLLFAMILLNQCENSTNPSENNAKLSVYLTDASAHYDSVIIVFSEISAHIDSQWVHVTQNPMRVNLLDWSNGETLLLGSADVPAGKYTQIRLMIDSAFVGIHGMLYKMDVPGGAQTGLKFGPQFTIADGSTYKMVIDFDASRSIVVKGSMHHPHGYSLKPHIRITAMAVTGSVSGKVLNPKDLPKAYAIAGIDTITTSIVDTTSGLFKLAFLPENAYTISIKDTLGKVFTQDNVHIIVGQDVPLGDITLQ